MKRLKKLSFFTFTVTVIALQSCGLSGNKASKTPLGPPVITDEKGYIAEVQPDSNKKMVALTKYLQPLLVDWKYASADNFTKQVLYDKPEAFVRLPAAKALQAIQAELKQKNVGLKFYDAYRPYSVTRKMWEIVPDERYAANPAKGSGHNRGIAVDLTLVDMETGKELLMPTTFDDFSEKAHHNYMQLDPEAIANRQLLRGIMEKHGFIALETEWWHYYLPDPTKYALMDLDFKQLRRLTRNN
jgi:zinc D-Ala-D-Ala dipeptidase